MFSGKKIVLGVTGGIAAYKAADIASWLTKNNADVHIVMTEAATKFIGPLVLQTLIGKPVVIDEFATGFGWQVVHISLVENAALMAIIPATANIIAKIAHGIADDALTSSVLAATCPIMVSPAMNVNMYENPATQENLKILAGRGYAILEPGVGRLACGTEGKGRLPDLDEIKNALTKMLLPKQDLAGQKVIVTAGPTVEPIDPVRYITNKSSGKMGYALAKAAKNRGAQVVLVSGPVSINAPVGVEFIQVQTAEEMRQAVLDHYADANLVIKAAAVADFRVDNPQNTKIKKALNHDELSLKLVKNPDILKELGLKKDKQVLVGFAAETNNLLEYASQKLQAKNLDLIVANDVSKPGAGFDIDTNIITIINRDGTEIEYEQCSKSVAADFILDAVAAELAKK